MRTKHTPIAIFNFQINSGPHRYSVTADVEGIGRWNERPLVNASGWIIPQEDFAPLYFYFSFFPWIHRALCASWDHAYRVGFKQVQSLKFLLLLGLFLLSCSFPFSGSLCCSFGHSLLCSLLSAIFCALCFSIRCAGFSIPSVNTLSARLLRYQDEQNTPLFEKGLIPSWRWDSRRVWPRPR